MLLWILWVNCLVLTEVTDFKQCILLNLLFMAVVAEYLLWQISCQRSPHLAATPWQKCRGDDQKSGVLGAMMLTGQHKSLKFCSRSSFHCKGRKGSWGAYLMINQSNPVKASTPVYLSCASEIVDLNRHLWFVQACRCTWVPDLANKEMVWIKETKESCC